MDYGLVTSDAELAAAVWRNFLGARGALGIFARGQAINPTALDKLPTPDQLERDPDKDDKSGVRDFEGEERDKYVDYPELMFTLVGYIRRQTAQLAAVSDETLIRHATNAQFDSLLDYVEPLPRIPMDDRNST